MVYIYIYNHIISYIYTYIALQQSLARELVITAKPSAEGRTYLKLPRSVHYCSAWCLPVRQGATALEMPQQLKQRRSPDGPDEFVAD